MGWAMRRVLRDAIIARLARFLFKLHHYHSLSYLDSRGKLAHTSAKLPARQSFFVGIPSLAGISFE